MTTFVWRALPRPTPACARRFCALLSNQGGFAFANGVEWLATEKIDVHGSPSLNWGAADNLVDHLRRLHALLVCHPAFFHPVTVEMIQAGDGNCLVVARRYQGTTRGVLVLINLDPGVETEARWDLDRSPVGRTGAIDLLNGETVGHRRRPSDRSSGAFTGAVTLPDRRCGRPDPPCPHRAPLSAHAGADSAPAVACQGLADSSLLSGHRQFGGRGIRIRLPGNCRHPPWVFCRRMNPDGGAPRTIVWQLPVDLRREVMVPPDHFLLVRRRPPLSGIDLRKPNRLGRGGKPHRRGR